MLPGISLYSYVYSCVNDIVFPLTRRDASEKLESEKRKNRVAGVLGVDAVTGSPLKTIRIRSRVLVNCPLVSSSDSGCPGCRHIWVDKFMNEIVNLALIRDYRGILTDSR